VGRGVQEGGLITAKSLKIRATFVIIRDKLKN